VKIAVVSTYPPSKGTLVEYGEHLVRYLALAGDHEIIVIADEANRERLPLPNGVSVRSVWEFDRLDTRKRIAKELNRVRPDAVLWNLQFATFGGKPVHGALGLTAVSKTARRWPTSVLLHNLVDTIDLASAGYASSVGKRKLFETAGRFLTRRMLKADTVCVTLPEYAELLGEKYDAKNVRVTPHGSFETPEFRKIEPEIPTVLCFGKWGTYKQTGLALKAHEQMRAAGRNVRLVIAGTDSPNCAGYLASVEAQVVSEGIEGVEFTGYIAEGKIGEMFDGATVVAFPYESTTGSSGVLNLSGVWSKAVVAPDVGDFTRAAEAEGYAPLAFIPGDVESYIAAIGTLLDDGEERARRAIANHTAATSLPLAYIAYRHVEFLRQANANRKERK
jgi:glycosyltransferase involved in cell wall biosynthesis